MSDGISELRRSIENVCNGYGAHKGKNDRSAESNEAAENYYIISQTMRSVERSRRTLARHLEMRRLTRKYCDECGLDANEDRLIDFFAGHGDELGYFDLALLPLCLSECALRSIAELNDVSRAIKLLHDLRKVDFERIISSVYIAEPVLRSTEAYDDFDERTKNEIRARLARVAFKHGRNERTEAAEICANAGSEGFCRSLFSVKTNRSYFAIAAAVFISLIFSAWVIIDAGISPGSYSATLFCIMLTVPMAYLALWCSARFISAFHEPFPVLRLKEKAVRNVRTLVCITTLLGNSSDDALKRLARFRAANKNQDCVYALLADLPESTHRDESYDEGRIAAAAAGIEKLNQRYCECFALFVRPRTANGEGKYSGRERKRGAVEDLVALINGDSTAFSTVYGAVDGLAECRYILTLDSDTNLSVGSVAEMLTAAMHPFCRPVINGDKITAGFGVLQPRMTVTSESASASAFSVLTASCVGIDVYENASFSTPVAVFGEGLFCGKGLVDVSAYKAAVADKLPSGYVLSHDIPEGALMRTMYLHDTVLSDNTPSGAVPYLVRSERWMRGDIQNLFLLRRIRSAVGRWAIGENAVRAVWPALSFASIIIAALLSALGKIPERGANAVLIFSLLPVVFPPLTGILSSPSRIAAVAFRRFFARSIQGVTLDFLRAVYDVVSFAQNGVNSAFACARALWRMVVSKKRRLEWITAGQAENSKRDTVAAYILAMLPSAIAGAVLFFAAPVGMYRLLGMLWFFWPVIAWLISRPIQRSKRRVCIPNVADEARRMFAYFEDNVNESSSFLPPDNVSMAPARSVAMRTSPTNIGMYLLALAAAHDFGMLDVRQISERAEKTLRTLERLERWRGHFFNWYDLTTLEPIGGRFVSTVDSGNLAASLIVFSEFLDELGIGELSARARILASADFSALYDEKRGLFRIGFDGRKGTLSDGCYDLYMSEARITSYYAVANCEVPAGHFKRLARTLTVDGGYVGMLSWTGTTFEYFMPSLFLPSPENSFVRESLEFALYEQRSFTIGGLWGISESGYFAFDAEMNYRYRAFGVPKLGMKFYTSGEAVVSPYSTWLMAPFAPAAARDNLKRLRKAGAYGKYGFYEAIDFSSERTEHSAVVKSYMAHHVGMSLAALANLCFDDVMVRRFMRDVRFDAARGLLDERIPEPDIFRPVAPPRPELPDTSRDVERVTGLADRCAPNCALLSDGSATIIATDLGHISVRRGGILMNDAYINRNDVSRTLTISCGGRSVCCDCTSFERGANTVTYVSARGRSVSRAVLFVADGAFVADVASSSAADISMSFVPVFERAEDFEAHPAFSKLFLSFEYDEKSKVLFIVRKSRKSAAEFYGAVSASGAEFSYSIGRDDKKENIDGCCVEPEITLTVRGSVSARFVICCGYSKERLLKDLKAAERFEPARSINALNYADRLRGLLYPYGGSGKAFLSRRTLWRFGLSGDYPLAYLCDPTPERLTSEVRFFRTLAVAGVRTELLISVNDDMYSRENERTAQKIIASLACEDFLSKRGGISIAHDMTSDEKSFAECIAYNKPLQRLAPRRNIPVICTTTFQHDDIPAEWGNVIHKVFGGAFVEKGFYVDKSFTRASVQAFVLTGRCFGTVVTGGSSGFTFFADSRNCRISYFANDSRMTHVGERLLIYREGEYVDALAVSSQVLFAAGKAVYRGEAFGVPYTVTVVCCEKWPVKLLEFVSDSPLETVFTVTPPSVGAAIFSPESAAGAYLPQSDMFVEVACSEGVTDSCDLTGTANAALTARSDKNTVYALFASRTVGAMRDIRSRISHGFFREQSEISETFARSMIPPARLNVAPALDVMFNFFLPYQTAASRFFARTGFWQSSGAYGYRDQLQDCLMLVKSMPSTVRTHIIRCAAHQYKEGDVQHWFLPGGVGVRTTCSDDMLYLPLVVAEYINATGDSGILDVKVKWLVSEDSGIEKCEKPQKSEVSDTVYEHCMRAVERSMKRGEHGLPLLGGCDWNDGFSAAGAGGKGESVLNCFFFVYVYEKFLPFVREHEAARTIRRRCAKLREAALGCFENGYFLRAFDDDGKKIGRIDAAVQAYAALSSIAPEAMVDSALSKAFDVLYDRELQILKLFSPPFEGDDRSIGYIQAYNPGVRENGGQYTHAAAMFLLALWRQGKRSEAFELLAALNPAQRMSAEGDRHLAMTYRSEPYALCGDVYSNPDMPGRGGWSHYTGSAAWYYNCIAEMFGL